MEIIVGLNGGSNTRLGSYHDDIIITQRNKEENIPFCQLFPFAKIQNGIGCII